MSPENMPIAPSAKVRHTVAFKRCKSFPLDAEVRVISTHNPWRPTAYGYRFFELVLRKRTTTTTIGQILKDAATVGYESNRAMSFLRWLFTWGDFLEINGKRYFPEPEEIADEKKTKRA